MRRLLGVLLILAAAPAAQAATVTVGRETLAAAGSPQGCNSTGCGNSFLNTALASPGRVTSPGDGVITGWRVQGIRTPTAESSLCPVVVGPPVSGKYAAGATAAPASCGTGVALAVDGSLNAIPTPLPVHVGDLIGVTVATTTATAQAFVRMSLVSGAVQQYFNTPLDTTPRTPTNTFAQEL